MFLFSFNNTLTSLNKLQWYINYYIILGDRSIIYLQVGREKGSVGGNEKSEIDRGRVTAFLVDQAVGWGHDFLKHTL